MQWDEAAAGGPRSAARSRRLRRDRVAYYVTMAIGTSGWVAARFDRSLPAWVLVAGFTSFLVGLIASWILARRACASGPHGADGHRSLRHSVEVELPGHGRGKASMRVEPDCLAVCRPWSLHDECIPIADVISIHERPVWIEIRLGDETIRVVPASYQARKDLLFDLALRCNAALERGIEDDSVQPPPLAQPGAAPRPIDDEMPAGGSGIPGLGSALAGPMHRGNPAPPRKSGLGVGLFALPETPREDRKD